MSFERKGGTVFQCELCGCLGNNGCLGYEDLHTAERCKGYCDIDGSCSLEITKKAIYKPNILIMPG